MVAAKGEDEAVGLTPNSRVTMYGNAEDSSTSMLA